MKTERSDGNRQCEICGIAWDQIYFAHGSKFCRDCCHRCIDTLKWYAGSLHPEDRLNDNGELAEKTLRVKGRAIDE